MKRVQISEISTVVGQEVELWGWLYNKRSSGKLHFLQVRDGSGIMQCVVYKEDVSPEVFQLCSDSTQESALIVSGIVRQDDRAPLGYELSVSNVKSVHQAAAYPIAPKEHGAAFLLDHRHLWLRSSRPHAILRVRSEVIKACRDFMDEHDFTLIDAPIFTPAACEGTSTLFAVDYFDEKAYLTQSGQLYSEAAAMAFGKVYCFGPTFRAEKSKTRRHLTEFWMIEPEMAFCDLEEDMNVAESMVAYVVERVLERRSEELKVLERDLTPLRKVQKPFPRITYDQAVEVLQEKGVEISWGDDLRGDEETVLSQHFDRPVLVSCYPKGIKAFYMKENPQDPRVALCVDMLAPEGYGEIIGGGQREDCLAVLENKIVAQQLPLEAFQWYLDLRRYGSVPHAGFGMGIERVVAWLCGLHHVRETIPFPRMISRLYP